MPVNKLYRVIFMYRCYNVKRFFRLLMIDLVVFSLCGIFFFIGKVLLSSAQDDGVFLPVVVPVPRRMLGREDRSGWWVGEHLHRGRGKSDREFLNGRPGKGKKIEM